MSPIRPTHDFEANIIYAPGSPASSDPQRFFGIQRGGLKRIAGMDYVSSTEWRAFGRQIPGYHKHADLFDYFSHRRVRLIALLKGEGFGEADLLFSKLCEALRESRGESIGILLEDAKGDPARMLFETDHAFAVPSAKVCLSTNVLPDDTRVSKAKEDYLHEWPGRIAAERLGWLRWSKHSAFRKLYHSGKPVNVAELENLGFLETVDSPSRLLDRLVDFHQALPREVVCQINSDAPQPNGSSCHRPLGPPSLRLIRGGRG